MLIACKYTAGGASPKHMRSGRHKLQGSKLVSFTWHNCRGIGQMPVRFLGFSRDRGREVEKDKEAGFSEYEYM